VGGFTTATDYTSEALLFTDRHFRPKVVDQFFNSNPVLFMLRKNAKLLSGGTSIELPSMVDESGNFAFFSKAETYTASDVQVFDAARAEWKLATQPVVIFEQDLLMNGDSKERRLNHVAARNVAASKEMANNFGNALFSLDHSATSKIDGLDHAVGTQTATGEESTANATYLGVVRAGTGTAATWNANVDASQSTTTLGGLQSSWGTATEGNEHPTLVVTSQTGYNRIWNLYSPHQRIGSDLLGKLGFQSLIFNGVPCVVDSHVPRSGGVNNTATNGTSGDYVYMLNMNHIYMVAHKQAFFNFRASPMPINQWVNIGRYFFMGNVVCDAPRYQAKITDLVA